MFHSNLHSYSRQSGFTLIELMVVVVIIAIVSAIAFPSMQRQIAQASVSRAAGDVESALKEARAEALVKRTNVTVQINNAGNLTARSNAGEVIRPVTMPTNVTIVPVRQTPNTMVFTANKLVKRNNANSDNLVPNSGFAICHRTAQVSRMVAIDAVANIRVISEGGVCP